MTVFAVWREELLNTALIGLYTNKTDAEEICFNLNNTKGSSRHDRAWVQQLTVQGSDKPWSPPLTGL